MTDAVRRRGISALCLAGFLVYGLACYFPVGWSPDGSKLVFPGMEKTPEGMSASLVLTDADLNPLRTVQLYLGQSEELPLTASWSPDGQTIAYVRAEPAPGEGAVAYVLALQNAATGEERMSSPRIVPADVADDFWEADGHFGPFYYPPAWAPDSAGVLAVLPSGANWELVRVPAGDPSKETVLRVFEAGVVGKSGLLAAVSPDGERVAWVERVTQGADGNAGAESSWVVFSGPVSGTARDRVMQFGAEPDMPMAYFFCWGRDSRSLFVCVNRGEEESARASVQLYEPGKEPRTVWAAEGFAAVRVHMALKADVLCVDALGRDAVRTDVVDLAAGKRTTALLGVPGFFGASLSPDGTKLAYAWGNVEKNGEPILWAVAKVNGETIRVRAAGEMSKAEEQELIAGMREASWQAAAKILTDASGLTALISEDDFRDLPPEAKEEVIRNSLTGIAGDYEGVLYDDGRHAALVLTLNQAGCLDAAATALAVFEAANPEHPLVPFLVSRLNKTVP